MRRRNYFCLSLRRFTISRGSRRPSNWPRRSAMRSGSGRRPISRPSADRRLAAGSTSISAIQTSTPALPKVTAFNEVMGGSERERRKLRLHRGRLQAGRRRDRCMAGHRDGSSADVAPTRAASVRPEIALDRRSRPALNPGPDRPRRRTTPPRPPSRRPRDRDGPCAGSPSPRFV